MLSEGSTKTNQQKPDVAMRNVKFIDFFNYVQLASI